MKHLVAISAHKNPEHLLVFVDQLQAMGMAVMIHLDKKSRETMLAKLGRHADLVIDKSFDVKRGHISIVHATLALMEASQDVDYDYFHNVSGEDFITKSPDDFVSFFLKHQGKDFINHNKLPIEEKDEVTHPLNGEFQCFYDQIPVSNYCHTFFKNGIGFVDTYHFQEASLFGKIINKLTRFGTFVRIYHRLFKRTLPSHDFYAGSAWMSLSKRTVDYFIETSCTQLELLDFMRHSSFPDEIYFQTLAMQSPFVSDIINSDLRFVNWENSNTYGPGFIDEKQLTTIKKSSGFFARKFDLSQGDLLAKIKEELL